LHQAVQVKPDNAEARLTLGLTHAWFRQFKEARDQAMAVLEKEPENAQALELLADTATTPETINQTQQLLDKVSSGAQAQAWYHIARGTLAARLKQLDKAETEYKQALAQDPKSSQAYLALGGLAMLRGDLKG